MFVHIAESLGIQSILHSDYESTCAKLAALGLQNEEGGTMEPANLHILTINGGSSSIKFALFEAAESLKRILAGGIERIGLPDATWHAKGVNRSG